MRLDHRFEYHCRRPDNDKELDLFWPPPQPSDIDKFSRTMIIGTEHPICRSKVVDKIVLVDKRGPRIQFVVHYRDKAPFEDLVELVNDASKVE